MSEMIDHVARAQWAAEWNEASVPFDLLSESEQNAQRVIARAAITAMSKPTDAMKQAGFELTGDPCWPEDVGRAWEAMINEALR